MRLTKLLAFGPFVVLAVWFIAGQWDAAGDEARAWLIFAAVLCAAFLLPLPGTSTSLAEVRTRMSWLGWVAVVGLLTVS